MAKMLPAMIVPSNGAILALAYRRPGGAHGGKRAVPRAVGMATSVIATVPVLIAFLVAQRAFVRGLSGTGLG